MTNPTVRDRRGYIGGSDAAALMGLSPYATPMQVFAEKTGRSIDVPDPARDILFFFGHLMEPAIGVAVQHFYPTLQLAPKQEGDDFFRSERYPFMGGHVDFLLADGRGFVECKNVRYDSAWGSMMPLPLEDDASHLVPDHYLCQCLHYMVVMDCTHCYLAAFFGGNELRIYRITAERNLALMQEIIEVEQRFQTECIDADMPPDPTVADDVVLRRQMFPASANDPGRIKTISPELIPKLAELTEARKKASHYKKVSEELRDEFILAVGDIGKLVDPDTGEQLARVEFRTREAFDAARMQREAPTAYAIYQTCRKESGYLTVRTEKAEKYTKPRKPQSRSLKAKT